MPTVVVSAFSVIRFLEGGGHFWVYMQYILGLRALGCDVYWMEQLPAGTNGDINAVAMLKFASLMGRFQLSNKVILYEEVPSDGKIRYFGRSEDEAEEILQRADLLLNFHYSISPQMLRYFRRTALVDIDPGLLQFWMSRGQLSVPPHDACFTIGEKIGASGAGYPDCGRTWHHIRPPVCLESWKYAYTPEARNFTTVSNWDADDWIVDDKVRYENTKRVAFLEFAALPRYTNQPLELALYLKTAADMDEKRRLETLGWQVRHSEDVACNPDAYRSYIQQSRGEFSCAKPCYVRFRTAWVSDRTLCYLASGKPAVVQHTGPSSVLPNGEGLFRFSTMGEAAQALSDINSRYEHHSRTARQLAEHLFDAKKIAGEILAIALR